MIEILNAIENAISIPLVPINSTKKQEQVIYNITPISDNGVIATVVLELNIVGFSLASAESNDAAIRKALLNAGDNSKLTGIASIEINGGGTLTSEVGVHRLVNYSIKLRSK